MRGVPLERGLQEPGKSPPPPTPLPRQSTSPAGPGAHPPLAQRQGANQVPRWDQEAETSPRVGEGSCCRSRLGLASLWSGLVCLLPAAPSACKVARGKGSTCKDLSAGQRPCAGNVVDLMVSTLFQKEEKRAEEHPQKV